MSSSSASPTSSEAGSAERSSKPGGLSRFDYAGSPIDYIPAYDAARSLPAAWKVRYEEALRQDAFWPSQEDLAGSRRLVASLDADGPI